MNICECCKKLFFPTKGYPNQRYCCKKCNFKQYEKTRKEEKKKYNKQWNEIHKEERREKSKIYREANKEKIAKQGKKYREINKEKIRKQKTQYSKKYRKKPKNQLNDSFSSAIRKALKRKGSSKNGNSWENIVGYTIQDLMEHLEKQFKEGMNWDNRNEWHIDHIRPISSFDYTSYEDEEFQECWSLENLQPLWAIENLKKGYKID